VNSQASLFPTAVDTLEIAKQKVEKGIAKGVICPCCGQFAKLYSRALNSGMARALIWLVKYQEWSGEKWADVPKKAPRYVLANREMGRLKFWGLAEDRVNIDSKKRTSGLWRATFNGIAFVHDEISVFSHVLLYNNQFRGLSGTLVGIQDVLGEKFDYAEIMKAAIPELATIEPQG
jgi:hypothetical protein